MEHIDIGQSTPIRLNLQGSTINTYVKLTPIDDKYQRVSKSLHFPEA